jgi:hypothetical protein
VSIIGSIWPGAANGRNITWSWLSLKGLLRLHCCFWNLWGGCVLLLLGGLIL